MMCLNKFHNSQRSDASQELTYRKTHQFGAYSSSMADSRKKDFSNPTHRTYIQAASTCGRCKKEVQTQTTCGACGLIGKVQKFGDCCICLLRDYKTEAHIAEAANQPDKMRACGLYDCTSTQNASFHGSSSQKQYSHKGVHARSCPQQAGNICDSGKSTTRGVWAKAAKELTREEEMLAAKKLLQSPDLDGDMILLMVQQVTVVTICLALVIAFLFNVHIVTNVQY